MAAAALSGLLPGLMDQAQQSPLGLNSLLNLGAYEIYGKNLETQRFNQQMQLAQAYNQNGMQLQRDFLNNQTGNINLMNQNQLNLQQGNFQGLRSLNSQNIKGQLANTAISGGISTLNSGLNLLGGYLNYKYNSNLMTQQFNDNTKFFHDQVDTMSNVFTNSGLPAWAAFSGGSSLLGAMPHATQVLGGMNARTAVLPGTQTQMANNTPTSLAFNTGVVG